MSEALREARELVRSSGRKVDAGDLLRTLGDTCVAIRQAVVALAIVFLVGIVVTQPERLAAILRKAGIRVIDVYGVHAELDELKQGLNEAQGVVAKLDAQNAETRDIVTSTRRLAEQPWTPKTAALVRTKLDTADSRLKASEGDVQSVKSLLDRQRMAQARIAERALETH